MIATNLVIDVLGWGGAASLLCAYALVSRRRVAGDSPGYQSLNVIGSILLLVNTVYYGAYPSAFVNVIWGVIAIWTLAKGRRGAVHSH